MLNLSAFNHNHHASRVKMVAKFIRRGIRVIILIHRLDARVGGRGRVVQLAGQRIAVAAVDPEDDHIPDVQRGAFVQVIQLVAELGGNDGIGIIIEQRINISQIKHHRHRSVTIFLVNGLLSGLIAYCR